MSPRGEMSILPSGERARSLSPRQALRCNLRIVYAATDVMGIDRRKVFVNLDRYGNTSGGSIPLALDEACQQGRIARGDRILVSGFGAGLAWGTTIMRW